MKHAYSVTNDAGGSQKPPEALSDSILYPFTRDEGFFKLLADTARDLIFHATLKPAFHFDYVSPSSTHITGYTPEEFYADPLLAVKCFLPEDLHLISNPSTLDSLSPNKPAEIRWRRKDGTIIWTEQNLTLTRDNEGNPETFTVIARDITERKESEAALLESQQFNTTLLDNVPHATLVIAPDTSIKYVNPAWERINGWTQAEIIGTKAPYPWWPSEYRDFFAEGFKQAMQQDSGKSEIVVQKKNGEIYFIDMTWVAVRNNGELAYIIINSIDITERVKAQQALKESESRYRSIFESANDVIVIMNLEGTIIDTNKKVKEITGYEREEIVGRKFTELTHIITKKSINDIRKNFAARMSGSSVSAYEIEMYKKDGQVIYFETNAMPLKVGDQTVGDVAILRDTTNEKHSLQALKESEEKFSTAFNSSPAMMAIVNIRDIKYTAVNDSFANCLGYTREEFIGHSPLEFKLLADDEEEARMGCVLKEKGAFRDKEFRFRTKSGDIRTWLCSTESLSIGGAPCMLAVSTDITERKIVQEALRESEEKFFKAFQASSSSISISRISDGTFIEVNDTFLRDKGYTREEVIGHNSTELKIFTDKENHTTIRDTVRRQGKFVNQERQYYNKAGELRTGLMSAEIIKIGQEPCMIVINTDITEQKKAEEQLRLLSSVTQQVSDSTVITDPRFRITYINKAAEEMFGYTLDEVRGKGLSILEKTKPSMSTLQEIHETLKSGKVFSYIVPKQRKDGTTIICDCRISPLYDEKGQIFSMIDVLRDITKEKEVEAKLQEHKKLIDSILATTPEGVLVIDSDKHVLLANKAFCKIFHLNNRTLKNKWLCDIFPASQFYDLHQAVTGGENEKHSLEFRYQVQSVEKIIDCVVVKMDGDRTLLTFSDVSREREEEEKLYLTDRLASIGEMAAGLAHELNNPLTGILALSELLTTDNLTAEQKEDIECIHGEAHRAADIVKNVLLFARNKTGENAQSSVNEVINEMIRLREYEERSSNITVVTNLEENLPNITLEKGQLQQVLLNLLSNAEAATKEMKRPGTITVTTQRVNNHVNIIFSDNGCGIKKQIIRRIFDPFFTTKDIGKGTGLGLSICYSIIVKHGGKISVKSQVSQGATFTIRMPIAM